MIKYNIENAHPSVVKNDPFVSGYLRERFNLDHLEKELRKSEPFPHILIAISNNKTVGMVLLYPHIDHDLVCPTDIPKNGIWVHRLHVDKKHRSQGIGKLLMTEAENYAATNGETDLWLDTIQASKYYEDQMNGYEYITSIPYKENTTRVYRKQLTPKV